MKILFRTFFLCSTPLIMSCPTHLGHKTCGTQPLIVKNSKTKREPVWVRNKTTEQQRPTVPQADGEKQ